MTRPSDLGAELWSRVQSEPSQQFWIGPDHVYDYSALSRMVLRYSALLSHHRVSPGQRILIQSRDDWATFTLWLSALLNGVVPVLVSPESAEDRLDAIAGRVEPKVIFKTEDMLLLWDKANTPGKAERIPLQDALNDAPAGNEPRLCMADTEIACIQMTSGSLKEPKGVVLTHENVRAHLATVAHVLNMSGTSRIYNGLVLHHADGLMQGPLLALGAGATVVRPHKFSAERMPADMAWFAEMGSTHLITAPAFLALVDRNCPRTDYFDRPEFIAILSSSAKLPELLWKRFEERFNTIVVNEYGMTETVAASHFAGRLPEMGAPYGIGKPIGCEARLKTAEGVVQNTDTAGELQLRGPSIFAGYLGAPELTQDAFDDGWLKTGDLAKRNADGDYEIVGRLKSAINFGGFTIWPEEIDEVVMRCPGVENAITVGLEDDVFGEVPATVFTAAQEIPALTVIEYCREHLEPRKVPKIALQIEAIPRTDSAKPALGEIRTRLQESQKRTLAKDQDNAHQLRLLAADVFGVTPDSLNHDSTPDNTPNWDSYAQTTLVLEIEQAFGIELSAADLMSVECFGDLMRIVSDAGAANADRDPVSIEPIKRGDSTVTLVVMPGMDGQTDYARRLIKHMSREIDVHIVTVSPGADEFFNGRSLAAMADDYADRIAGADLKSPLVLLGFSFAGFIAYETSATLARRGVDVSGLILLDTAVPWTHHRYRHKLKAQRLWRRLRGQTDPNQVNHPANNEREGFELPEFGIVWLSNFPEHARHRVKSSFIALSQYKPSRSSVPMLVFESEARGKGRIPKEPNLGWHRFTSGAIETVVLGKRHTSIAADEPVAVLAVERIRSFVLNGLPQD